MKSPTTLSQHGKLFRQMLAAWKIDDPRGIELIRAINGTARMLEVLADHGLQTRGLSLPRLRLLLVLYAEEQNGDRAGISPSHLSDWQHISKNTVSSLLESLEDDGLIERTLNPEDKRKFNIRLTRAGKSLIAQVMPEHSTQLADAVAVLTSEEQNTLLKLLDKLRGSLKEKLIQQRAEK